MNIPKITGLIFVACSIYLLFDHLVLPWWITNQPQHLARPATVMIDRHQATQRDQPDPVEFGALTVQNTSSSQNGRCDGRTHCSQMTSCTEAQYFLANCPNTEMDGDHDGIPCERQWCKHL